MTIPAQRHDGEQLRRRSQFAFLIHPRAHVSEDFGLVHPLLGKIPDSAYEWGLRHLPVKPWVMSTVRASDRPDEVLGHVIVTPLSPTHLLSAPRAWVSQKINETIDFAVGKGATLVGLGALTAPATGGGAALRKRTDVGVTNGNAFTAAATAESIVRVAQAMGGSPTIALVGATGSVGTAVARVLARANASDDLLLIGRSTQRLEALARELGGAKVSVSTSMDDCRRAKIVVLMTSATEALLGSEHLCEGAIVIDDTQPRNTRPELLEERPDVRVVDGGLVETPGLLRTGRSIGLPSDTSFACLAETSLLALDGHVGHATLGRPSAVEVDRMSVLAQTYSGLGFSLAPATSFGQPITVPGWSAPSQVPPVRDLDGVQA